MNNTFLALANNEGRLGTLTVVSNDEFVANVYSALGIHEADAEALAHWAAALSLPEGSEGAETRDSLPFSVVYSPFAGKAGLPGDNLSVDNIFAASPSLAFSSDVDKIIRGSGAMQTEAASQHSELMVIGVADHGFVMI